MKLWNRASRGQSSCPALALLLPSSFHPLLPPPTSPHLPPPQLVSRHVSLQLSLLRLFRLSFLLHKITEAEERAAVTQRGTQPAGPTSRLRAPSSPQARSLPVPSLSSTVSAFSRLQVRPVRSGWGHRKTKTENEVPCFVFFIDE